MPAGRKNPLCDTHPGEAGRLQSSVAPSTAPGNGERLHRLIGSLFRVHNFNDIHERASELGLRLPVGRKRADRLATIRSAGTLFVHVPKNAGTSINTLLYGRTMRHETARYYRSVAPDLFRGGAERFAIWRDPVQRFLSAYDFARQGGGRSVRVHPYFAAIHRRFRSLDDAIDHVATAPSVYALDHVFRPQKWYLTGRNGKLLVDRLYPFEGLNTLPKHVPALAGCTIPHLNDSRRTTHSLSAAQEARIRRLYAADEALRDVLSPA